MSILLLAVIGVAAGFVASRIMRAELSTAETVAVGLIGAVVGGILLRAAIAATSIAFGLVGAVAGACLTIWLYRRFLKR